jgi:hypothetical protein
VLNPDGLLLTMKDPDSQETDRYMMRLVAPAKDAAELKMIAMSMPPGMSKPKPWRLTKNVIAPAAKAPAPHWARAYRISSGRSAISMTNPRPTVVIIASGTWLLG